MSKEAVLGFGIILFAGWFFLHRSPATTPEEPVSATVTTLPTAPVTQTTEAVPPKIDTEFLSDCWLHNVREHPTWATSPADWPEGQDVLESLASGGSIGVRFDVVGNRLWTDTIKLTERTKYNENDAGTVYSTALRAILACGIAEIPLPNGSFILTFDPSIATIAVAEAPKTTD